MKIAVMGLLLISSVSNANILPAAETGFKTIGTISKLFTVAPETVPAVSGILKSMGYADAVTSTGQLRIKLTPAEEAKVLKQLKVSDQVRLKYPEYFTISYANSNTTAIQDKVISATNTTGKIDTKYTTTSTSTSGNFTTYKTFISNMTAAAKAHPESAARIDSIATNVGKIYGETDMVLMSANNCIVNGQVGAKSIENIDGIVSKVKYELTAEKPVISKSSDKMACAERVASYEYLVQMDKTLGFKAIDDAIPAMKYLCENCGNCPVSFGKYISNLTSFPTAPYGCN